MSFTAKITSILKNHSMREMRGCAMNTREIIIADAVIAGVLGVVFFRGFQ